MPRSDEPDTTSTKEQSPEPTPAKESSPSPEPFCQERVSGIRESSVNSSIKVQSPGSKEERELSAESVDDEGGSLKSDTLSADSVCSRCGGSKRDKNTGLEPPAQFTCKCHLQKDEIRDVESISLQEIPLADVAEEDISQIDNCAYDQLPDLPGESTPDEQNTPVREEQTQNEPEEAERFNVSCDLSCDNIRWNVVLVIIFFVLILVAVFLYLIVRFSVTKGTDTSGNVTHPADLD